MTFVNTALLFALAAVGIPIALHLIARKEPKKVMFPSVRLLTQRFETNRSKVRVRRWWLLALRIAAFAVVALALARPVIAGALSLTWSTIGILSIAGIALLAMASVAAGKPNQKTLVRSLLAAAALALIIAVGWGGYTLASGTKPEIDDATPVALAIVVDNAPLAAWRTGDETQLNRLRAAAKQLILAANRESRFAVIDRSSAPAAFSLDVTGALSKTDALRALEVVQPLESRVEAAARLLQTSEIPSRQVVILSGLTESSFANELSGQSLAALLESSGVAVTVWDMGGPVGTNRTVSLPTLSDVSPAPETSITVAAVLSLEAAATTVDEATDSETNPDGATAETSETPPGSLSVTAECVLFPSSPALPVVRDGDIVRPQAKPVDRLSVTMQPGRDVELQMTLPPLPVGLHHGAIRLVGADALAVDDASYFSVAVLPPSRLLLVSDQAEEAEEIAWAVSAPAPIDDPASQYAIERIGYDDMAASRMTDFDGVILLDPPDSALGEPELIRYREQGGSVWVAAGDRLGEENVAVEGWPVFRRRWRVPEPGTFLEISAASHPALVTLANTPGGVPFQDFRIHQYWQLAPSDNAQVLMRYAGTDHAAVVEWRSKSAAEVSTPQNASGSGRIVLMTTPIPAITPPSSSWNELFQADEYWPAFSLVRDVTRYVTGRSAESWMTRVGAPVSIPVRQQAAIEVDGKPRRLQWFPPVGATPVPINVPQSEDAGSGGTLRIVVGQPKHSGVHWIRGDEIGLGFTANLPREQLATTRIDAARLERLFGPDRLRQIDSLDEMEWTSSDDARVVSLWSPIMLLALFVFMLEQVLGNRFYRRSPAAKSGSTRRRSAA
ncbi:BatA domain-containing protein [Stieleria sp.]|uniref:BatA domain-containing protein n=1 Tax=Stieleria sp. TaxID=2795976 RepID=UPI0035616847